MNEATTIQKLFKEPIENIYLKTVDPAKRKVIFTDLMMNKNATPTQIEKKKFEWLELFENVKKPIIDCISIQGTPFFEFRIKDNKVLLTADVETDYLINRFEVVYNINKNDLEDFRRTLKRYIEGCTQVNSQIIESAIPALIENNIPEFQNEEGDIIETPEKIFNVWAENFPAIVDLVRFFKLNINNPNKVRAYTDSEGETAGYFLLFDSMPEINQSVANSGKKYDLLKRQLKALTEKAHFAIRRNVKVKGIPKSKIIGGTITSLVKSIKWNDENGKIRIEASELLVLFDRSEIRLKSLPTNIRDIWEKYGQRKAHHCKAFLWCVHNLRSSQTISKVKFMSVCGLHDISRNRREQAFKGCLDFLEFTGIVRSVTEYDNGILLFNFNKFMIPHVDKFNKSKKKS